MSEYWQVIKCCSCGYGAELIGNITRISVTNREVQCPECGRDYEPKLAHCLDLGASEGTSCLPISFLRQLPEVKDEVEDERELVVIR